MKKSSMAISLCLVLLGTFSYAGKGGKPPQKAAQAAQASQSPSKGFHRNDRARKPVRRRKGKSVSNSFQFGQSVARVFEPKLLLPKGIRTKEESESTTRRENKRIEIWEIKDNIKSKNKSSPRLKSIPEEKIIKVGNKIKVLPQQPVVAEKNKKSFSPRLKTIQEEKIIKVGSRIIVFSTKPVVLNKNKKR